MAALDHDSDCQAQALRLQQLIALGGEEKVVAMLGRFAAQVESFLAAEPQEGWPEESVHRLIGAAAMLGFSSLEASWRVMEQGPATAAQAACAVKAGRAAVHFVHNWRA